MVKTTAIFALALTVGYTFGSPLPVRSIADGSDLQQRNLFANVEARDTLDVRRLSAKQFFKNVGKGLGKLFKMLRRDVYDDEVLAAREIQEDLFTRDLDFEERDLFDADTDLASRGVILKGALIGAAAGYIVPKVAHKIHQAWSGTAPAAQSQSTAGPPSQADADATGPTARALQDLELDQLD